VGWFSRKKPEPKDPADKRRAERVPIFEITDVFGAGERLKAVVKDISLSGIRFSLPHQLEKQTVLKVRIDYNPVDFPVRALVVWVRPVSENEFDHGAEFVNVPQDEMNLLADHLETLKAALAEQAS